MNTRRKALVRGRPWSKDKTLTESVEAYLPSNYYVVREINEHTIEIAGTDSSGWTLDDYVIPRLWSGLYACEEIVD